MVDKYFHSDYDRKSYSIQHCKRSCNDALLYVYAYK